MHTYFPEGGLCFSLRGLRCYVAQAGPMLQVGCCRESREPGVIRAPPSACLPPFPVLALD